jgi:G2/mitotic-specific cyclin 1/2
MSPCESPQSTQKLFPNKTYLLSAKLPLKDPTTESTADTYHSFQSECRLQILPTLNPRLAFHDDIIYHLRKQEEVLKVTGKGILERHKITMEFRAKMVDWIIEVINKAECTSQTLFLSVSILDRFLYSSKSSYKNSNLHLMGVVAMALASKFEEVQGMDIVFMYSQVVHNKISEKEMADFEMKMFQVLNFTVLAPTELEFLEVFIESLGEEVGNVLAQAQYIATLNLHSIDVMGIKPSLRAAANLLISSKESFVLPPKQALKKLSFLSGASEEEIENTAKIIEQHRKDFKKLYPKLKNAINNVQ